MHKLLIIAILALGLSGCLFQARGQPFPTATQMLAACDTEMENGTPSSKAPDCMSYWVVSNGCGVQAVANSVNPIIIPAATAGNPLFGSLLGTGASLNTTICKQKGFLK